MAHDFEKRLERRRFGGALGSPSYAPSPNHWEVPDSAAASGCVRRDLDSLLVVCPRHAEY